MPQAEDQAADVLAAGSAREQPEARVVRVVFDVEEAWQEDYTIIDWKLTRTRKTDISNSNGRYSDELEFN